MNPLSIFRKKEQSRERSPEYYSYHIVLSTLDIVSEFDEKIGNNAPFDGRQNDNGKMDLEIFWAFYCYTIHWATITITGEQLYEFDKKLCLAVITQIVEFKPKDFAPKFMGRLLQQNSWKLDYPDRARYYLNDELTEKERNQIELIKKLFLPKDADDEVINGIYMSFLLKLFYKVLESLNYEIGDDFILVWPVYALLVDKYTSLIDEQWSVTTPVL